MPTVPMQAKDIPATPILEFLKRCADRDSAEFGPTGTLSFGPDDELRPNSVQHGMPAGVPFKVARAKMVSLIRRGLVSGCTCGCRGDFEITQKGLTELAAGAGAP